MNRYAGNIGYGETLEEPTGSGKFKDVITEREYFGDIIRNTRSLETGDSVNPNISVSNSISIVADEYAFAHFFNIRYISWMGKNWTVDNVEVRSPRLILSLSGLYNGPLPGGG
jgi:hypothetical protein